LSFQESVLGAKKEVRVTHHEICKSCQGGGYCLPSSFIRNPYPECPICDGTGIDNSSTIIKRLEVTVPPGVNSNTRLRVRGEGDIGQCGGCSGDLYICLSIDTNED
jgi:molecular chaperone DnaJ